MSLVGLFFNGKVLGSFFYEERGYRASALCLAGALPYNLFRFLQFRCGCVYVAGVLELVNDGTECSIDFFE